MKTVREKIASGEYEPKVVYPKSHHWECLKCHRHIKDKTYCPDCGTKTHYEERQIEYSKSLAEYRKSCSAAKALFKEDALKEVGLYEHPNKDKAYTKAWEDSHSCGYSSILCDLEELADLML